MLHGPKHPDTHTGLMQTVLLQVSETSTVIDGENTNERVSLVSAASQGRRLRRRGLVVANGSHQLGVTGSVQVHRGLHRPQELSAVGGQALSVRLALSCMDTQLLTHPTRLL